VTRSRLAVCKNEKNEGSAKADFRHLPPGHFVWRVFGRQVWWRCHAVLERL
jgi:hypothetical protein